MGDTGIYTAEELAERAGVPLRTVRYYLQEGLIDAPMGVGRGAHFNETHLKQLKRIRVLQEAGFDLKTIRDAGHDAARVLKNMDAATLKRLGQWRSILALAVKASQGGGGDDDDDGEGEGGPLDIKRAVRVPMADGVELLVDKSLPMPSPKDLVDIALMIRKKFGGK